MSVHSLIVQSIGHLVQVHDAQPPWRPLVCRHAEEKLTENLVKQTFKKLILKRKQLRYVKNMQFSY